MAEPNPCTGLTELQKRFDAYREDTAERLAGTDVRLATINTKLNWLIGMLSAVGTAVLAEVVGAG